MTKEEKKAAKEAKAAEEANKPFGERNYWKLSKSEKKRWLSEKGLTTFNDVVIPILTPLAGILIMIVGAVFLVFTLCFPSSFQKGKEALWIACCCVIMAIGLGVAIWQFFSSKKEHKGLFINQYYSGDVSSTERMHREIDQEAEAVEATNEDLPSDDVGLDDLEI